MDHEKQIRLLLSENEFLQEQLEELNLTIEKKEEDLLELANRIPESEALLRSKIEGNLIEIKQLNDNYNEAEQKIKTSEIINEELELDFVKEIKEGQKNKAVIKELTSVSTQIDILNSELNETANLYKRVQELKKELSEAKSIAELKIIENEDLRIELEELKALFLALKRQKSTS